MEWILDGKSFPSKTCCWLLPPPSDYSDKTGHHHHEHTVNHGTLRDISSPTSTIYKCKPRSKGMAKHHYRSLYFLNKNQRIWKRESPILKGQKQKEEATQQASSFPRESPATCRLPTA
ncbi:hypothetical protein OIU84_004999 [Salix udensis]|uniref:Uncharacterized protein n=1 Tax=Salix udensis TaxID=889485 RepID=A0AAD6JVC1_9ROSI|nr:hypothetical protein OIU84_004999 [Salix udensis]